jgi:hypothetical protein
MKEDKSNKEKKKICDRCGKKIGYYYSILNDGKNQVCMCEKCHDSLVKWFNKLK